MSRLKFFKNKIQNFLDAKLPFEILEAFEPVDNKYIDSNFRIFQELNDKVLIIDINEKLNSKISLVLSSIALTAFLFFGRNLKEGLSHPMAIFMISILVIIIVYSLVKLFVSKKSFNYSREVY